MYLLLTTYPDRGSRNIGDALITHSLTRLLNEVKGDVEVATQYRADPVDPEQANRSRGVLMPGFAIRDRTWPDIYALPDDLAAIRVPMLPVGAGTMAYTRHHEDAYRQALDGPTHALLDRIQADVGPIPCRNHFTVTVLTANGRDATLVGDCAFYDPYHLGSPLRAPSRIRRVAFTPPRRPRLVRQAVEAIWALQSQPGVEVRVFHHGLPFPAEQAVADQAGVSTVNLAGDDMRGFNTYDDVDLHVGYRVHAHVWRLRTRRPSILIEEDSRAVGFRQTLGLEGIASGSPRPDPPPFWRRASRKAKLPVRRWPQSDVPVAGPLLDVVSRHLATGFEDFELALSRIDWLWEHRMRPLLQSLP